MSELFYSDVQGFQLDKRNGLDIPVVIGVWKMPWKGGRFVSISLLNEKQLNYWTYIGTHSALGSFFVSSYFRYIEIFWASAYARGNKDFKDDNSLEVGK